MFRKKALLLLVILCSIFIIAGCSSTDNEPQSNSAPEEKTQETVQNEVSKKTIGLADVVQYFKDQGLSVGDVSTKAYDMMGAVDGFGLDVGGNQVELYMFDPEKANEETLKNLDDAEKIGKFSAMGFSFPVVKNGNILLAGYEEHPEKDKIIEMFKSFK